MTDEAGFSLLELSASELIPRLCATSDTHKVNFELRSDEAGFSLLELSASELIPRLCATPDTHKA